MTTQFTSIRDLPRQQRNYIVLLITIGALVTVFNGVLVLIDQERNSLHLGLTLLLFASIPITKSAIRLRRGDVYVYHYFWEFPIIVGLALAPPYGVILSMGVTTFITGLWYYFRNPQMRVEITQRVGAVCISITLAGYIGILLTPISYAFAAILFFFFKEFFTFISESLFISRSQAWKNLKYNLFNRVLIVVALSLAVTIATIFLGPHREYITVLPIVFLFAYWIVQNRKMSKDQRVSWQNMESISSMFIGEIEEHKTISIALEKSLKLFGCKKSELFLYATSEEPASKWELDEGDNATVNVEIYMEESQILYPEKTLHTEIIDLSVADITYGYMIIEWDEKIPENKRRVMFAEPFGHSVALAIANTRNTKTISLQASEKAREAERDPLTSLGNRSMLSERGPVLLAESSDINRSCALLLFDLDGFKRVNDTLGHAAGDQVIQEVATRIQNTTRRNDLAIRLGGDEFAVLAVDLEYPHEAEMLASKITRALMPPVQVEGLQLSVESSIGVAVYPHDASTIETLLKLADIAMYQAKSYGRGKTVRYSSVYDTNTHESLQLSSDLRNAIYAPDQLILHYQPQIDLKTGQVAGFEGLVRWEHPRHGLLYPDQFVHLAERSNLVRAFTLRIIRQAILDKKIMREILPNATVSVNLSAQNLLDIGLSLDVKNLLEDNQVKPEELVLEVTETTTAKDVIAANKILGDLSELGCAIAMDDFGSGYATMESLRNGSPVTEIKIDKGFVQNIDTSERDYRVVRAIIDIAHAWDCRVVAEGVETRETFCALVDLKCDIGQGYWMHKPGPLNDILDWVKNSTPIGI